MKSINNKCPRPKVCPKKRYCRESQDDCMEDTKCGIKEGVGKRDPKQYKYKRHNAKPVSIEEELGY